MLTHAYVRTLTAWKSIAYFSENTKTINSMKIFETKRKYKTNIFSLYDIITIWQKG